MLDVDRRSRPSFLPATRFHSQRVLSGSWSKSVDTPPPPVTLRALLLPGSIGVPGGFFNSTQRRRAEKPANTALIYGSISFQTLSGGRLQARPFENLSSR